jgi:hypothetical protein
MRAVVAYNEACRQFAAEAEPTAVLERGDAKLGGASPHRRTPRL